MDNSLDNSDEALCRTCLQILRNTPLSLIHDIFITPDLSKKLVICTSLTVELQDGFPKYLCDCCYKKVNEYHKFQTMCVESVQRFRDMQRQKGAQRHALEDEKPVFDLDDHDKLEIGITEPDIFNQNYGCEDLNSSDSKIDNNFGVRCMRSTQGKKRKCSAKTKPFRIVSKETKLEFNVSSQQVRSTRSQTCKLREHKDKIGEKQASKEIKNSVRLLHPNSGVELKNIDYEKVKYGAESGSVEANDKEDKMLNINQEPVIAETSSITIKRRRRIDINKKRKLCKRYIKESELPKKSQIYQCEICPTRFFVEHRLVAHKRSHDGLMPYPCTFKGCDKGFNRWHCLSEHLKQHNGTNQWYTCEEEGCGKVYKHKPTLSMHLRKFHRKGPELKSHICEICGKLFKASAILNDHRYTHKDKSELPFACEEEHCDRRFSSKEKLKVHMMRHAGIKNFVCPYCGMRKTTRNELKIHINYHTLERTWPCRFCEHVCNSAGNLKMHVRTVHERAKDYACRFCDRTFAKPDTRKYHEMTHTGEKPNECKECGKRFTQPAALRTHRKIHLRHREQASSLVEESVIENTNRVTKMDCISNNVASQVTSLLLPSPVENSANEVESQMHVFLQNS